MARVKPQNLHPVRSLEDATETLAEIGKLKRCLSDLESRLNDDVDALKADAAEQAAPLRSRLEALENGLAAFGEAQKESLFKDRRSVVLDYGTLGFRRSTVLSLLKGATWKGVLGTLKEMKFLDAVRVKEEPDKDVMATWPDERIGRCTLGTLSASLEEAGIRNHALIVIGRCLEPGSRRSAV